MSFSKSFAVFTAFIAWFALGLQLYIMIDNVSGNGLTVLGAITRFLVFFTILTNLLVAVCLTVRAASPSNALGRFFEKPAVLAAVAVYIFIVALVYNLILRKLWAPVGNQRLADELLHVIVPIFYLAYWFLFAPKYGLQWSHTLQWLSYPAAYLVYALVRGAAEGFYAYPFIDVNENGALKVLLNSIVLMAVFVIAGLAVIVIAKKMTGKKIIA
jgi:hypothetical protein